MRDFIDSIFRPVTGWLDDIIGRLGSLSVPVARPLNISAYVGHISILGPVWESFVTTVAALAFIYLVVYLIVANFGLFIKFKNAIKWW